MSTPASPGPQVPEQPTGFFVTREIVAGFLAPLESLKFFAEHKIYLLMGLAPFVVGLVCYFWVFSLWGLPWVVSLLATWGFDPTGTGLLVTAGLTAIYYIGAFILFALLGMPLVTVLASPLFDIIAEKAFHTHVKFPVQIPALSVRLFVRSFVNETLKTMLVIGCLFASFVVPLLAPFAALGGLWFFGWDHLDRTLAILHLPLRKRIFFGFRHFLACVSLGIWRYMPLIGTLLAFVMSAAGALTVARISKQKELIR